MLHIHSNAFDLGRHCHGITCNVISSCMVKVINSCALNPRQTCDQQPQHLYTFSNSRRISAVTEYRSHILPSLHVYPHWNNQLTARHNYGKIREVVVKVFRPQTALMREKKLNCTGLGQILHAHSWSEYVQSAGHQFNFIGEQFEMLVINLFRICHKKKRKTLQPVRTAKTQNSQLLQN